MGIGSNAEWTSNIVALAKWKSYTVWFTQHFAQLTLSIHCLLLHKTQKTWTFFVKRKEDSVLIYIMFGLGENKYVGPYFTDNLTRMEITMRMQFNAVNQSVMIKDSILEVIVGLEVRLLKNRMYTIIF